jgi:hypothetical protein
MMMDQKNLLICSVWLIPKLRIEVTTSHKCLLSINLLHQQPSIYITLLKVKLLLKHNSLT